MLTIHKYVTSSPEQMEMIIEGMRNPMNSWDRMDSHIIYIEDPETLETASYDYLIGDNDFGLMENLANGGPVHAKYRRMMDVIVHVTAPLYWWKEFDTYKIGTVGNSCSTMHKIHAKEFTLEDFSCEKLFNDEEEGTSADYYHQSSLVATIYSLNKARDKYLECTKQLKHNAFESWNEAMICKAEQKKYWWQMIQLLPSSYNQRRTIKLNYEVLHNIYQSRRNHRLDEWHVFCDWIERLPYADLITGKEE